MSDEISQDEVDETISWLRGTHDSILEVSKNAVDNPVEAALRVLSVLVGRGRSW